MAESHAIFKTDRASRYLQQLCKHFAHKVKSEFDATTGRVEFPPGLCHMTADGESLAFYCQSGKAQGLLVMQGIIDNHLKRFAWCEEFELAWAEGLPADLPEPVRREMGAGNRDHA